MSKKILQTTPSFSIPSPRLKATASIRLQLMETKLAAQAAQTGIDQRSMWKVKPDPTCSRFELFQPGSLLGHNLIPELGKWPSLR